VLVLDTGIGVTFLEILVGRMLAMPSSIHPEVGVVRQQAWTEARVRLVGGREPVVEGNYEVAPTRGCCTLESLHGGFYVAVTAAPPAASGAAFFPSPAPASRTRSEGRSRPCWLTHSRTRRPASLPQKQSQAR